MPQLNHLSTNVAQGPGTTNAGDSIAVASNMTSITAEGLAQVRRVADRYGDAAHAGWSPLPDVLLFSQAKLEISSEELNVLLNMMAHFYEPGAMPFVRSNVIAKRMGVSTRSVQRVIAQLRKKRLIMKRAGPKREVIHDLQPLLNKLQPLAQDRIKDKEARRAQRLHEQAMLKWKG